MGSATHAVPNFLGGEISAFAQGRFDDPKYRVSLNVCLNAFPVEIGPWVRRPGTAHAMTTRGGEQAKVIKFDFEQANAVSLEFTDGFLRFRNGASLVNTNDAQVIVAISTANPAVVQTTSATNWVTGNTLVFSAPSTPLLENRQFVATKIDTTHFSIADAITGATIDGSTLGALASGATVSRVMELTTVYSAGAWSAIRLVQAEITGILLTGTLAVQALTVTTLPTGTQPAVFALNPATFLDGPYLDPFTNGVQAAPGGVSGIITVTLSFPAWSSTTAYAAGEFVTSSSINYVSLQDQNVNETPASSPAFWQATTGSAAIGPNGFQGTDVGRLVRFFSEPAIWLTASVYAAGAVVSYNPSGSPGATTYWQSLTSGNTGHAPGSDLTNWELIPQGAAIWTWGRITSLSNVIDRNLSGSLNIGNMTASGGLAAAFDGVFSKPFASSAEVSTSGSGSFAQGAVTGLGGGFVGKNYSGASNQKIQQATVFPSSDAGLVFGTYKESSSGLNRPFSTTIFLTLRGKATAPSSPSDGTALGTTGAISNTTQAVTIISSDQTTAWAYVWIEVEATATFGAASSSFTLAATIAQVSFFNPPGTGATSAGVNVEILGPPLLYAAEVLTWRIGVYSNTTGFPTCGTWHEGRLWLGGAISNRFDASVSNGISGNTINMAPTDQFGVVSDNSALDYTLNSDSVNPIFAMEPDLQGVIMFTQAGEYLVQAPTSGPITPTNIAARRVTKIGGANVEPRRTDHTTVFVQRFGQKLMEYFSDVFSGKFSAPNLADKAQHITAPGIVELAYCSAVTPIIWGRGDDDSLFGVTYKRDTLTTSQGPTFAGWHRQALGSGRGVESICAGPSVGGDLDSLTMVTNDTTTNIRHVEVLTDTPDETTALADCWFLDDAVTPTSTSSSSAPVTGAPYGGLTINGLWPHNGKTVQVFAGGLDCGNLGDNKATFSDFIVSNGSIFVPYGDGVSAGPGNGLFTSAFVATNPPIVVGFTYNSDGQLVRAIADTGARSGPAALGLQRDLHRYALLVSNSRGISIGTSFASIDPVNFNQDGAALGVLDTFSGIAQGQLVGNGDYDGMLCWRASRPNSPANIVALAINLEAKDQ